jgi:hypothetical protein
MIGKEHRQRRVLTLLPDQNSLTQELAATLKYYEVAFPLPLILLATPLSHTERYCRQRETNKLQAC